MSIVDSVSSQSACDTEHDIHIKMMEAGQIGFQLAEEIRHLREQVLTLKQEKRILLVNNENLEISIQKGNKIISSLKEKCREQHQIVAELKTKKTKQANDLQNMDCELKNLRKMFSSEKKKGKLLGQELERSLEDEVALRGYSRQLENEIVALKDQLRIRNDSERAEADVRLHCYNFIETAIRSQLVTDKKLETIACLCDKDVDMCSASIFEVNSDYLDNLLKDVHSAVMVSACGTSGTSAAMPLRYDFSALEHRHRNVNHQLNQHISIIRAHISKLRKNERKTRIHVRNLLDVIQTYEDLPVLTTTQHQFCVNGKHLAENSPAVVDSVSATDGRQIDTADAYVGDTLPNRSRSRVSEAANGLHHRSAVLSGQRMQLFSSLQS